MAGHPLLARRQAAAVDMASDGERAPSRRLPTRVRAASAYRTSPANKGKTSPSKVKRRSAAAEPILSQPRGEPIMDRRGNQHDAATGRFTHKAAGSAPSVMPGDRAGPANSESVRDATPGAGQPQPESGRSSPDTLASFNTVTSASILRAHLAAGDTDEEDADPSNTSPGSDMVAKLKEAEERLGAMRSEIDDAALNSDQLRAELQTANANYSALQSEFQKANSRIEKLKVGNVSIRSEMQMHTDQLIEQIHDEHKQEVADLENEVEVLRLQMHTPAIIKPRSVKDVAVGGVSIDFQPEEETRDHPQPTAQTADKNSNSVFLIFFIFFVKICIFSANF